MCLGIERPAQMPNSAALDRISQAARDVDVTCDWACSPMVGRSSGTLPTRVQILVLAPFPGFIPGFSGVMR
jgi:hypothetical protein